MGFVSSQPRRYCEIFAELIVGKCEDIGLGNLVNEKDIHRCPSLVSFCFGFGHNRIGATGQCESLLVSGAVPISNGVCRDRLCLYQYPADHSKAGLRLSSQCLTSYSSVASTL